MTDDEDNALDDDDKIIFYFQQIVSFQIDVIVTLFP